MPCRNMSRKDEKQHSIAPQYNNGCCCCCCFSHKCMWLHQFSLLLLLWLSALWLLIYLMLLILHSLRKHLCNQNVCFSTRSFCVNKTFAGKSTLLWWSIVLSDIHLGHSCHILFVKENRENICVRCVYVLTNIDDTDFHFSSIYMNLFIVWWTIGIVIWRGAKIVQGYLIK